MTQAWTSHLVVHTNCKKQIKPSEECLVRGHTSRRCVFEDQGFNFISIPENFK